MNLDSVRVLIDGYNLLHQTPVMQRGSGSEWLHSQRIRLIHSLANFLSIEERSSVMCVFDAHTHRSPNTTDFVLELIRVRFAHEYSEADDLIEEFIDSHPSPNSLLVVSSDRRIQNAAKSCHVQFVDSRQWFDELVSRHPKLNKASSTHTTDDPEAIKNSSITEDDIKWWAAYLEMQKVTVADVNANRTRPKSVGFSQPPNESRNQSKTNKSKSRNTNPKADERASSRNGPNKIPNPGSVDEAGIDPKILKRANRKLPDEGPLFPEDYLDGFS